MPTLSLKMCCAVSGDGMYFASGCSGSPHSGGEVLVSVCMPLSLLIGSHCITSITIMHSITLTIMLTYSCGTGDKHHVWKSILVIMELFIAASFCLSRTISKCKTTRQNGWCHGIYHVFIGWCDDTIPNAVLCRVPVIVLLEYGNRTDKVWLYVYISRDECTPCMTHCLVIDTPRMQIHTGVLLQTT